MISTNREYIFAESTSGGHQGMNNNNQTGQQDSSGSSDSSDRPFKCEICNSTFTRLGNYTRHKKIHSLPTKVSFLYIVRYLHVTDMLDSNRRTKDSDVKSVPSPSSRDAILLVIFTYIEELNLIDVLSVAKDTFVTLTS